MSEIDSLHRENEDLKDLNIRISKELQKCLVVLGVDAPKGVDLPADMPPWATNATFLCPILLSYDNRIHEVETNLELERKKFTELNEQSRRITQENVSIREEMEKRWKEMIERQKTDFEHGGSGSTLYLEERNELQTRVDLLNQEVNILIEQVQTFRANNEYLEKFSREREDTAEKATSQYRSLFTEFQESKMIIEELRNHKEIVEDKLKIIVERFAQAEKELQETITGLNRATNENRVLAKQSEIHRDAYEELDRRKSKDIQILMQENESYQQKEVDTTNRTMLHEKELEETRDILRQYKRDLDNTKQECNNMMKILEDFEAKVSVYQQKEEGYIKLSKECKAKMEDSVMERDRIQLHEQQLLRQLDRIQEQKRLEMVEQQNKYEQLRESTRAKHESVCRSRDEEIKALSARANDVQLQLEERSREWATLKRMYETAHSGLKEENNKIHMAMNDNDKRAREAEELRLVEKRNSEAQGEKLSSERNEWERAKKSFEATVQGLRKEMESVRRNGQSFSDDNRRLHSQIEDLIKERDTLIKELNCIRQSYYERLQEASVEFNTKLSGLESQLVQEHDMRMFSEDKALELMKAQDSISDRWKTEHQKVIRYYDRILGQMSEQQAKFLNE